MTSDVVLTAALRANLLSLQNTQSLVDITQNRLATGRKINSALDGPQAFFASQALNNRAGDLGRLLDSIGQSIQVIKAADNGITALTKLVEQADSIVTSAREIIAKAQSEAKVTGNVDLRNIDDLTALTGWPAGSAMTFTLTRADGVVRQIDSFGAGSPGATETINIAAGTSTAELLTQLNSIVDEDNNHVIEASLNEKGQLVVKTTNGDNFGINFTTTANSDVANLGLANGLGLSQVVRVIPDGTGTSDVKFTSIAGTALESFALYDGTVSPAAVAQRSDLLSSLVNSAGTALFSDLDNVADDYRIAINGGAAQTINMTNAAGGPVSIQEFIDQINGNGTLNTKIKADFDEKTGVLSIKAIDASVTSITTTVVGDDGPQANFGFGTIDLNATGTDPISEHIVLGAATATLAKLEQDYNKLREQIDLLVQDTGYRGTNLLNGDELLTIFNEDRTSSLTTKGSVFTADGLGMDVADFSRIDTIESAIGQVRDALTLVRDFGSTLANDLSVIQAREVFTKELINTLTEGSDKLVNADQNEEGAKLLALQTRQQLGVTSLSLASQSQQAVLRLFG